MDVPEPLTRQRQAAAVIKAATKGWACVCLLFCFVSIALAIGKSREIPLRPPNADELTIDCVYLVATGFVTFLATACLVGPYIFWIKPADLARRLWRMYLETGFLALVAVAILTPFLKAQVDSFAATFKPLAIFALCVSNAATFFYLRDVKANQL